MTTHPCITDPVELLRNAAWLIEQPGCWTQGYEARDLLGLRCSALSDRAVSWCTEGALLALSGGLDAPMREAKRAITSVIGHWAFLHEWNDRPDRTAGQVAKMMREAADRLERER